MINCCIVDEGSLVSIFHACVWRGMVYPRLVLTTSQLLDLIEELVQPWEFLLKHLLLLVGILLLVKFMVIEYPSNSICSSGVIMFIPCKLWCQHSFM